MVDSEMTTSKGLLYRSLGGYSFLVEETLRERSLEGSMAMRVPRLYTANRTTVDMATNQADPSYLAYQQVKKELYLANADIRVSMAT